MNSTLSNTKRLKVIKNFHLLQEFEDKIICEERLSFEKKLKLFEAMWKEGVSLGVLPPKNPLEGIEVDINIARILNSCLKIS